MQRDFPVRAAGCARGVAVALTVAGALGAAGCTGLETASRPTAIPEPPLTLLASGPLELPPLCEPARGAVYRTDFVVTREGQVRSARPAVQRGCVEDALVGWVETFRYAPLASETATTLDWMAVVARR